MSKVCPYRIVEKIKFIDRDRYTKAQEYAECHGHDCPFYCWVADTGSENFDDNCM